MKIALWRTIFLLSLLHLAGCAPVPDRGFWGQHARWPGLHETRLAVIDAATNPKTWIPAVGSALFSLGNLDEEVSDWATRHQPLFGSDASDDSDTLRSATTVAYLATALAAPSGDSVGEWTRNKVQGLLIGGAAIGLNDLSTGGIKKMTGKERPDEADHHSFPSGHASQAAVRATLAARNLDYIAMPGWGRTTLKTSFYTLAAGTGWARVEADRHFPSDVLAGFALGHFLARFIDQAFLAPTLSGTAMILPDVSPDRFGLTLHLVF